MPEGVELHVKEMAGAKRVGVASRDQSLSSGAARSY